MAYYLGYRKDGDFKPISLNIDDALDILSIVNFTITFENEEILKQYLNEERLITSRYVELSYLIDKGKKGNKTYQELPNIKRVFYSSHASSFEIEKIKIYLKNKSKDKAFVEYLLANMLKKYGIEEQLRGFILGNLSNQSRQAYLKTVFSLLLTNSTISEFNDKIHTLIKDIEKEKASLYEDVGDFLSYSSSNNEAMTYLYRMLNRHFNIPTLAHIKDLKTLGYLLSSPYPKNDEIETLIENFINHYIFSGNKINSRNLVDLGSMIQDYKDYLLKLDLERFAPSSTEEEDYEDEDEFLEEEDFARYDTTSENAGIRLRPTDSSQWRPCN